VTSRPHNNLDLIRRVLGDDYIELEIKRLDLDEDFASEVSRVTVTLADHDREVSVKGEGCGMVDALWSALAGRFSAEYESLKSVELAGFTVETNIDTKKHAEGTDAIGEVCLDVKNSDGESFGFKDASRSIASSSARAVLAAMEYFVNAERAFIKLHASLQDAKSRNRTDLVTRYTREIAEVVKSTSYAAVIEKIRKEAEI